MSNWADHSEEAARGTPAAGSAVPHVANQADPGWYPDPWSAGHHRYWNGSSWTSHAFPDGPGAYDRFAPPAPAGVATATPAAQGGAEDSTGTYPTTDWSAQATQTDWPPPSRDPAPTAAYPAADWSASATEADRWGSPPGGPGQEPDRRSGWPPTGRSLVVLLAVMVLVVGGISMGATYLALRKPSKPIAQGSPTTNPANPTNPTNPTNPANPALPGVAPGTGGSGQTPATPSTPATPAAVALRQLVVKQSDVPSTASVELRDNGDQVSGEATLDLCNGTFASESLRTDRFQVDALDTQGDTVLSTEAVAYTNSSATIQAFTELKATAANCPSGPVESPVGEPTVTTKFNAAPDGSWPQVPGVDREAFDFTSTDSTGQSYHSVAAYLRRGRFFEGVYFPVPSGTQVAVNGQTTVPGIVNVFALRLAALPASLANGNG